MKIKPEIFLISKQDSIYNKILITGSDESLISHVTEQVVKQFRYKNYLIESSGVVNKALAGDLFSDKKVLFLLKDNLIKKEDFEIPDNLDQCILVSSGNNKKISWLKTDLSKSKSGLLIDCYPLNRSSKQTVIQSYVEKNNINLSKEVFWYLVDSLENEYVLLNNQLELLSLFDNKISSISVIDKIIFIENKIQLNKIFFQLLKNSNILINFFNIYSQTDFYIFLNSIKLYFGIISESLTKEEALSKFPKYLFSEKDVFIKIFDKLDKEKLKKIYNNIFKVEKLVRTNSGLYYEIGIRFLLNTKKIINS